MKNEQIFAKHFNQQMKGVRLGFTDIEKFMRTYPSLYKVIVDSMSEVERLTRAENLKQLK